MKKTHGRVSAAEQELHSELEATGLSQIISSTSRPAPPYGISERAADEWIKVTNSMPASWFSPETHGILAQYCKHIDAAATITEMIDEAFPDGKPGVADLKVYGNLLYMQREESKSIATLSTKLRITNQATINKRGNQIASAQNVDADPWEADDY